MKAEKKPPSSKIKHQANITSIVQVGSRGKTVNLGQLVTEVEVQFHRSMIEYREPVIIILLPIRKCVTSFAWKTLAAVSNAVCRR